MFIRKKKNKLGSISVQSSGKYKLIKTIYEISILMEKAKQEIQRIEQQNSLFIFEKDALVESFVSEFVVYPNPVKDAFAVSIDSKKIEIYNITSQLVKTFANKFSDESLSVSDLKNGIYLVKIIDVNNNQATKKFIKQ